MPSGPVVEMASKWPAHEMARERQSLATHTQNGCQTGIASRRGPYATTPFPHTWLLRGCPLTGLAGGLAVRLGRCWRSHALPRLQVRSSQTKLNLQLCSYLLQTPDLGTFPTTPPRTKQPPDTSNLGILCAATSPEPQTRHSSLLSLFLRHPYPSSCDSAAS